MCPAQLDRVTLITEIRRRMVHVAWQPWCLPPVVLEINALTKTDHLVT